MSKPHHKTETARYQEQRQLMNDMRYAVPPSECLVIRPDGSKDLVPAMSWMEALRKVGENHSRKRR